MAVADFGNVVEVEVLERRSAAYHRAAAARARRLRAEATTAWSKEYLAEAVARHEQIAAEVTRRLSPTRLPRRSKMNPQPVQAKPPDDKAGGSATSPAGTTGAPVEA